MPLLGDCDMLPIDVFNELFQHTTTARWNGNPDWTKPYRIATYRTMVNRTEPYRARQRASREWKYKLKVEMKVRVPFELQSVSQSALSSGSRAAN